MTYFSLDSVIELLDVIISGFSGLVSIIEHPVKWVVDRFLDFYGPNTFIGRAIGKILEFILFPVEDVPLYEVLFGSLLILLVFWIIFKFFIDSLPLLG